MAQVEKSGTPRFVQTLKKIAVSAFVAATFTIYAIHDKMINADGSIAFAPTVSPDASQATTLPQSADQNASPTPSPSPSPFPAVSSASPAPTRLTDLALSGVTAVATNADVPTATDAPTATGVPPTATIVPPTATDVPTDVPPTTVPRSAYKDGTYTGPVTDAFYGNVQVRVIIRGGKITQIKFLDYPHDRRTSQQINNYAIPRLQQEVIQAQNLNVNVISGATLTSEAFGRSMQAALNQAQN